MTPKEKAQQLVDRFLKEDFVMIVQDPDEPGNPWANSGCITIKSCKQAALICVAQEIDTLMEIFDAYVVSEFQQYVYDRLNFLGRVKEEIISI